MPHFTWLPHLPLPALIVGLAGCAALVVFGLLFDRGMQRAEDRAELNEFTEEIAEVIVIPPGGDWEAGHGTRYFFGTDLVAYDPEADAAVFMERQDRDVREFMSQLVET